MIQETKLIHLNGFKYFIEIKRFVAGLEYEMHAYTNKKMKLINEKHLTYFRIDGENRGCLDYTPLEVMLTTTHL